MNFADNWQIEFCYALEDFEARRNPNIMYPWYRIVHPAHEMMIWDGLPPRHKEGLYAQFPEVGWKENTDAVMEQIWAIGIGLADCPVPGFRKVVKVSYPRLWENPRKELGE